MTPQRDYYADLGLSQTADVAEIKKQFRKLALKYHPDRNPGREQEVNSQFQIIQAAHEVLSDPDAKAKYDAAFLRSTSRYPAASGVRGNPWQNVGQQFPVPPRRNPPRTAPSGAQRWNERFSAGVPPTAKQHASAATAARAFESMRKGGAKSGQQDRRPPPPPPPPPRTESAKKRAEAAFGKKTGYYPRSSSPRDEPPVTNHNYSSRYNTERSEPAPEPARTPEPEPAPEAIPDPLASFRQKSRSEESFQDPRQSSPYTKSGGEKTDPFDNIPMNRETSTKESFESAVPSTPKRRSSSMPRREARDGAQRKQDETGAGARPRVVPVAPSSRSASSYKYQTDAAATASTLNGNIFAANQTGNPSATGDATQSSSNDTAFNKTSSPVTGPSIFNFSLDDDTFAPDSPSRFRKSTSADGINTTFVKDGSSATWQFSAGSGDNDAIPQNRPPPDTQADRPSPIKRRPVANANASAPNPGAPAPQTTAGFNPDSWSAQFGPQTFVHRPTTPKASVSPTRQSRANSRKAKYTKPSASRDDSSDDDRYLWTGRRTDSKAATVGSPQAMDIDPPSAASPAPRIATPPPLVPPATVTASNAAPPAPQSRSQSQPPSHPSVAARNIPVEPSRPEWRPGNVTGLGQMYEQSEERKEIPVTFKGSEDSEEFRATFEDLKNVAPFATPKAGLKSFTELKDNLPFESQASSELHLNVPHAHPLVFPEPPIAPKFPPTVAVDGIKPNVASWNKYLEEFDSYLRRWDLFNSQVVDHFATRNSNISQARASKGYSFLGARNDADIMEYHNWVEQDNGVRRRWQTACEEHELRFREFMAFREKMKSTT